MRNALSVAIFGISGLFVTAGCGGDSERPPVSWSPTERLPGAHERWWGERVERYCEDNYDCRVSEGERCAEVRLGTCPRCPRSETAMVCVEDGEVVNDLQHAEADDWELREHYNDD